MNVVVQMQLLGISVIMIMLKLLYHTPNLPVCIYIKWNRVHLQSLKSLFKNTIQLKETPLMILNTVSMCILNIPEQRQC